VDADAISRKKVRGQIIHYAEQIFRYQHRTALYMLLIIGRRFRFLRWDRSGTIVTRAADYFEQPDLLCKMLWRMSQLNEEQLGYDPSAIRIDRTDPDYLRMNTIALPVETDADHMERKLDDDMLDDAPVYRYVRDMFRRSLHPEWPRYRLEVKDTDSGETHSFFVGRPIFHAPGMAGRGTRGYVAFHHESGRFVWLKDVWRADYKLVDKEGITLKKLNMAGVDNVPTLVCHGDILGQTTKTPDYWGKKDDPGASATDENATNASATSAPGRSPAAPVASSSQTLATSQFSTSRSHKRSRDEANDGTDDTLSPSDPNIDGKNPKRSEECPLRLHAHYRLVVKEVALPLKDFQSSCQLVSIILDTVVAHQEAVEKANIIHRDISGGNILIFPKVAHDLEAGTKGLNWSGLLTDWELSKPLRHESGQLRARQPERTGTWQYMSVAVLSKSTKVVETSDELESFFHVLLYNAIRYTRSNCENVGAFIEAFFDSYTVDGNKYECGTKKMNTMHGITKLTAAGPSGEVVRFLSEPLNDLLDTFLAWFKAHYAVQAYAESQKNHSKLLFKPATKPELAPPSALRRFPMKKYSKARLGALPPGQFVSEEKAPSKPDPKVEADALKVATHSHMQTALDEAMDAKGWVADRVDGDNVPDSFKAVHPVGPPVGAATSTVKRRRTEQTCGPAFPFCQRDYGSLAPRTPPRHDATC
ncbi:hypothetical protein TRAPUB_2397, partial [Trametes pubescens]